MLKSKRSIDALHDLREAVSKWVKAQPPTTDADIDLLISWWQCYPHQFEQGYMPVGSDLPEKAIAKLEQRRAELHGGSIA